MNEPIKLMASGTIAQNVPNSYGPGVDIKAYNTESNRYTCPCDGYLRLQAISTSSAVNAIVFGADGNTSTYSPTISVRYANGNTFNSMFVRRGMQIYIKDNTQNDGVFFIPLV